MTQAAGTSWYCRKCNKSTGERWTAVCPHADCRGHNTIARGKPETNVGGARAFQDTAPQRASDIKIDPYARIPTGTREFDRVLGGGLVIGSAVLISGDPGIGKSTLLIQTARDITVGEVRNRDTGALEDPYKVLYVCAEETVAQVKGRLDRVGPGSKELWLYHQASVIEIDKKIAELDPDVVIIDSIQTMVHPDYEGGAGSATQVRACTDYLIGIFKSNDISAFIVGHITKEGIVAGPKIIEHLVDAVVEFNQEGHGELRRLRASKNRFGDTSEMALFRMKKDGLISIENPSELLLENHKDGDIGMCVGVAADTPRPMFVEAQSLLDGIDFESKRPPKRHVTGIDSKRVNQVMAVLSRRTDVPLKWVDAFVSIAGGLEFKDPGLDLPVALSLISQALEIAMPASFCAFGEIGLLGEIRPVAYLEARIKAAALMGFERIMGPYIPGMDVGGDEDDDDEEETGDGDLDDLPDALSKSDPPSKPASKLKGDSSADEDATTDGMDRYVAVQSLQDVLAVLEFDEAIKPKAKQAKKPQRKKRAPKKNGKAAHPTSGVPHLTVVGQDERT